VSGREVSARNGNDGMARPGYRRKCLLRLRQRGKSRAYDRSCDQGFRAGIAVARQKCSLFEALEVKRGFALPDVERPVDRAFAILRLGCIHMRHQESLSRSDVDRIGVWYVLRVRAVEIASNQTRIIACSAQTANGPPWDRANARGHYGWMVISVEAYPIRDVFVAFHIFPCAAKRSMSKRRS
jgi:hypothetical protein